LVDALAAGVGHAMATAAGGSLREVIDRLGHSTTVAAVRYQHVMADRRGRSYRFS
jgi:hypothetical protein